MKTFYNEKYEITKDGKIFILYKDIISHGKKHKHSEISKKKISESLKKRGDANHV